MQCLQDAYSPPWLCSGACSSNSPSAETAYGSGEPPPRAMVVRLTEAIVRQPRMQSVLTPEPGSSGEGDPHFKHRPGPKVCYSGLLSQKRLTSQCILPQPWHRNRGVQCCSGLLGLVWHWLQGPGVQLIRRMMGLVTAGPSAAAWEQRVQFPLSVPSDTPASPIDRQ